MRTPEPISVERFAELNDFRKEKWPGFEFQRFLCIWLRVECGLSTDSIAQILGWHVNTIRFTQKDFIKRGVTALKESSKVRTADSGKKWRSSYSNHVPG